MGPNNLWPWPIYSLGPKARVEESYGPGSVVQVQNSLETQPRTIQSSTCLRSHWKEGQKRYRNSLEKNLKISMSVGKDTLDSLTTKDKGKAALTAIQYSTPNRAILSSFYNHPQPLWIWADGTSISLEKVDPTCGRWIKEYKPV